MNRQAWRVALIGPVLLLGACGLREQARTTRLLEDRMQARLADDIAANRAVLQPVPDGVRVTFLTPSPFPNDVRASDNKYPDLRATVIEGLLDPSLMRVAVVDTSDLPDDQRVARVNNVLGYFAEYGLSSTLRQVEPPVPAGPGAGPASGPVGLTITVSVACPPRHSGYSSSNWGYGSGRAEPACF